MSLIIRSLTGTFIAALAASALAQTAGQADPTASSQPAEVLAYGTALSSERSSSPITRVLAGTVGDPIIGPIIIVGSYLLGVPVDVIAGLGSVGAAAQEQRSAAKRDGNWDTFTYRPPEGYFACAVKVYGDSIRPQSRQRPKLSATGSREAMSFTIAHNGNADSSAVKLRLEILAVRADAWDKHSQRCHFSQATASIVPLCRGGECTPHVTGAQWRPVR
jgi:hypothetical protein